MEGEKIEGQVENKLKNGRQMQACNNYIKCKWTKYSN